MSVAFDTFGKADAPSRAVEKRVTFSVHKQNKADDLGEGVIRFAASTGREDRDGDTINPSGIRTGEYASNPVFLQFHDYGRLPAGRVINWKVENVDGQDAFIIDVKFPTKADDLGYAAEADMPEQAKMALAIYRFYKAGMMNSVSIGFAPIEGEVERREAGGFHFNEIELLEVSAVPVPSNRDAHALMRDAGEDGALLKSWAKSVLTDTQKEVVQTSTSDAVTKDIPAPPERFREQIKLGLKWHEDGFSGDGVEPDTIRQANALADGEVPSEDKIGKALSFFARHLAQDHDRRDEDGNPTPYLVALKLWGGQDEGPPYWRRAGRAAGMDVEKMWVREVLKAGQTLSRANQNRAKRAIWNVAKMMESQGMDAATILAEMSEEEEGDKGSSVGSITVKIDVGNPDFRTTLADSIEDTLDGDTETRTAADVIAVLRGTFTESGTVTEDTKMITEDNVSDLMSMAVDLQSAAADMMQILHSDDPAAASDAFAGLLAESSDHVTGMSEAFNEGTEEPEPDAEDEPEPPEQDAMDGEDEDEDKSPQSPPVEGGKDVDWDDVEIALTDQ